MRHKDDVDSYNENNTHNAQISLFDYDFTKDIAEAELPTEYNEDEVAIELGDLDWFPLCERDGTLQ